MNHYQPISLKEIILTSRMAACNCPPRVVNGCLRGDRTMNLSCCLVVDQFWSTSVGNTSRGIVTVS